MAAAPTVDAYSFRPINTAFTGTGVLNVFLTPGRNIGCIAQYKGRVNAKGDAIITNASFCAGIMATGLSWHFRPTTTTRARFESVSFDVQGFGSCLPTEVHLELNGSGLVTQRITHMAGSPSGTCKVWGHFQTSPAISIVP
jgi:hypothetical protein